MKFLLHVLINAFTSFFKFSIRLNAVNENIDDLSFPIFSLIALIKSFYKS